MIKLSELEFVFENLGSISNLTAEEFGKLEEFVCRLYGCKGADVDFARYPFFMKNHATQTKVVDLPLLLPCKQVLRLHAARANAIATMWKSSTIHEINLSGIINVGWYSDMSIQWTENEFPEDLRDMLLDSDHDNIDIDMGIDEESEDDDE
jgi:hypothetical protein